MNQNIWGQNKSTPVISGNYIFFDLPSQSKALNISKSSWSGISSVVSRFINSLKWSLYQVLSWKDTDLQVRRWLWDFVSRSSFLKANFSILPPSFDTIALKESIWMSLLWSQYSSNKSIYSRNWSFDGSPVQT